MPSSPIVLLREAIKAVPAVKYALGVAGLGATVAIIIGFKVDIRIMIFGIAIIIALMFALAVFAAGVEHDNSGMKVLALLSAWAFMIIVIASVGLLASSFFYHTPLDFRESTNNLNRSDTSTEPQGSELNNPVTDPKKYPGTSKKKASFVSNIALPRDLVKAIESQGIIDGGKSGEIVISIEVPDPRSLKSSDDERYRYDSSCYYIKVKNSECGKCISLLGTDSHGDKDKDGLKDQRLQMLMDLIKKDATRIAKQIALCAASK
jgi:hypothetical protein